MEKRSTMMRRLRCAGLVALLFLICAGPAFSLEEGEGYDENTEVTITGTVKDVVKEGRGPVIVRVSFRKRIYNVLTAPPWYLIQADMVFSPGSEVEVTGSKLLRDGMIYLAARRVKDKKSGKEILLRDDSLRPLWRGRRRGRNGS